MADGVAITAGSGTTILTDDTGTGGHAQVVKLAISTDGSGTLIPAEATYGLLSSGVARRDLVRISVALSGVTTATTAYTAGDQVGTQVSLTGAARASGGSGTIVAVQLIDQSDIIGAYDVVFSRASITPASDNAAFAISDADSLNVVGLVALAGAYDIGNNRIAQATNLAVPYDCSGGTTLYANLITRYGHTFFTAGALPQLVVWVELN